MCLMVYLAADEPLRPEPWDPASPAFYVGALADDEAPVGMQFSKPHLAYAGSHEGCGCGFQCGRWPSESFEPDELRLCGESLAAFAEYLEAEIRRVGPIELFACWDGDQTEPPELRRKLGPSALRAPGFFFAEKELSIVIPD
jgi:hypothetical protein